MQDRANGLRRISLPETVRKVSDVLVALPFGPPRCSFLTHFVLRMPAKSKLGALLVPLFGQFLEVTFSEVGLLGGPRAVLCLYAIPKLQNILSSSGPLLAGPLGI